MNKRKIIAERKRAQGRMRQHMRRERLRQQGIVERSYTATHEQHDVLKKTLKELQSEEKNNA